MKNQLGRFLYLKIIGLSLLVSVIAILLFVKDFSGKDEQNKEVRKRLPGSMLSMDLWSSMRTYPYSSMDASAFSESFEQALDMSAPKINAMLGVYSPSTAPWTALGPMNFAGRILSLAFHPTDANIMWAGSASGGLWKTITGGTGAPGGINWQYVPTGFPVLGVSSIVVHPTNADIIYIGTGEVYSSNAPATGTIGAGHVRTFRGSYGIGILKTINGGTSWTKVLDFANSNLKGVMDLAIHPTKPDTVFAATTDGLYRTFNGGTNWTLIHATTLAMDLCFKPGNPDVLYMGSGNFGSAGSGIYKTINANAAVPTFTKLTTGLPASTGKIMLSISPNNTSKIYASIGRNPNVTTDPCGLYLSTDEGLSWIPTPYIGNPSSKVTNQGWYAHDIAANPANANTVLWGELDFWYSANSGSAFSQVGFWGSWDVTNMTIGTTMEGLNDNYVHADVHRIQFSPHDPSGNTVFVCTDGGIFRSIDGGQNYQTINGGLLTAQIYSNMAISKTDPNFMVGGLQDNEGFIYNGSPGCKRIPSLGDGFHCAINTRDDDTCYITGYYFNLKRSVNRGNSFSDVGVALGNPPSETASFNTPFVLAPSNPNIMYAGTYRIKKSTNRGSTWLNTTSALFNTSCAILYIAVAPSDPNTVYISVAPGGALNSRLLKTTNGGSTYTNITGTLPNRYYSDIVVDPTDPNRVAVTLSGFGTSHVYMSHNGGTNWSDLGAGLTDVPHNTLMFDPNNRRTLYVGNDLGVFYANSVPIGALAPSTPLTWIAYNEGLNDGAMISDLLVTSTNKIRLATYGRGLWERDLATTSSLPVIFRQFDVSVISGGNQLKWIISSQSNVSRYDIEYTTDGMNFSKVGSVGAKNTGGGDATYTYLHAVKNDVNGFYRIKNVDMDDSYTYSSVEMVKATKLVARITVYPNPTTGLFKIRLPTNIKETVKLIVYDNTGRLVMLKNIQVQPGTDIPVDISRVTKGSYQVVCEGINTRWVTSVIKK